MLASRPINDHATRPTRKLRKINADIFGGGEALDQAIKLTGKRTASRSRVVGAQEAPSDRLKGVEKKPLWQLAPDGVTIERSYDGEEPLEVG